MEQKIKQSILKIIKILIIIFLLWSVGAKYISQHEFIHHQIFKQYGIDSKVQINYLTLNGVTMPNKDYYTKCDSFCKMQHTINDVIGYNVALFIYFIFIIIISWRLLK